MIGDTREYRETHQNLELNARSIINKKTELSIMVEDIKPHIIGVHFQAIQRAHILLNINNVCIIRLTLFPSYVLIFDHLISINKMAANYTVLANCRLYKEQTFFLT